MIEKYISLVKPYYNESHRKFHDWNHIRYGLSLFEELNTGTTEQLLAWLFHDIVYDIYKKDNEHQSALMAMQLITSEGDDLIVDLNVVSTIINDTKTHIPTIEQSKIVLDIDMSSLAMNNYTDFFNQRLLAAQEYSVFGKDAVTAGTKNFIEQTLQHSIFTSDFFREKESIAKENLARYLKEFSVHPQYLSLFEHH